MESPSPPRQWQSASEGMIRAGGYAHEDEEHDEEMGAVYTNPIRAATPSIAPPSLAALAVAIPPPPLPPPPPVAPLPPAAFAPPRSILSSSPGPLAAQGTALALRSQITHSNPLHASRAAATPSSSSPSPRRTARVSLSDLGCEPGTRLAYSLKVVVACKEAVELESRIRRTCILCLGLVTLPSLFFSFSYASILFSLFVNISVYRHVTEAQLPDRDSEKVFRGAVLLSGLPLPPVGRYMRPARIVSFLEACAFAFLTWWRGWCLGGESSEGLGGADGGSSRYAVPCQTYVAAMLLVSVFSSVISIVSSALLQSSVNRLRDLQREFPPASVRGDVRFVQESLRKKLSLPQDWRPSTKPLPAVFLEDKDGALVLASILVARRREAEAAAAGTAGAAGGAAGPAIEDDENENPLDLKQLAELGRDALGGPSSSSSSSTSSPASAAASTVPVVVLIPSPHPFMTFPYSRVDFGLERDVSWDPDYLQGRDSDMQSTMQEDIARTVGMVLCCGCAGA
jgi:hypothetical protein